MALFGFGKKKEEKDAKKTAGCCCSGDLNEKTMAQAEVGKTLGAPIKVLGSGCKKCNELEANTKEALMELGMDTKVAHVTDFAEIAAYGVMTTPALVVDGKVVAYGKVLKKNEIMEILKKNRG